MQRVVGIIGGMGPLATVDLLNKIILYTPAVVDQDHIHVIVDNYPKIPDRTKAIINNEESPVPYMIESAKRLQSLGAEVIAIACNTAHYYYQEIQESISIPILHMPEETIRFIKANNLNKVGLIATDGTLRTGIYSNTLKKCGVCVLEPEDRLQMKVMEGIYQVKRGNIKEGRLDIEDVVNWFIKMGVEAVIAGCTEAAYVLSSYKNVPIIDPTTILAKVIVDVASTRNEVTFVNSCLF